MTAAYLRPAAADLRTGWRPGAAGRWTAARLTTRGLIQAGLGMVLYFAGANVGSAWVVLLSAAALGTVGHAMVVVQRAKWRVTVTRGVPGTLVAGEEVAVRLTAVAPTAGRLVVADDLTGAVGASRAGEPLTATARLRRGLLDGARVRVLVSDRFGLASAWASGQVGGRVLVLPAAPSQPVVTAGAAGVGTQLAGAGAGSEPVGVRLYRPGDPPRSVHWRATARHGRLVVRDTAREAGPLLVVAVAGGQWRRDDLDAACDRACGLATAATAAGRRVELSADGRRLPWSPAARRDLALLPPHAGAPARPLAAPPSPPDAEVVLLSQQQPEPEAAR